VTWWWAASLLATAAGISMLSPVRIACALAAGSLVRPWWGALALAAAIEALIQFALIGPAAAMEGRSVRWETAVGGYVAMLAWTLIIWAFARRIRRRRKVADSPI
jgi:hypothetical protein